MGVPWRPAKRQNQELFAQKVGFWADGAADEEGDAAATALDKEVRAWRFFERVMASKRMP